MGIFSKKKKEAKASAGGGAGVSKAAAVGIKGHEVVVNPNPRSESSYRRHVGRAGRLLLAIEKAEQRGQTERVEILQSELAQRKLAIQSFEVAKGGR